jgi:hypothetical protein
MRKRLTSVLVLGIALASIFTAFALADTSIKLIVGELEVTVKGGFSPTKLPKNKLAPIHLRAGGAIGLRNGKHPPALTEVVVETDKNGTINAKGLPKCTAAKLAARTTKAALKACRPALVGEGKTDVEIAFAEQEPFIVHSTLLAFNGGVSGGKTTIFIHAFLSNPVSAAVVTTVKVSKIHNGRFGTKSVAAVPPIAGGNGSAKSFQLEFFRTFTYKGKKQSYLQAKCADGKLKARAKAILNDFIGGTPAITTPEGELSFPCIPKKG